MILRSKHIHIKKTASGARLAQGYVFSKAEVKSMGISAKSYRYGYGLFLEGRKEKDKRLISYGCEKQKRLLFRLIKDLRLKRDDCIHLLLFVTKKVNRSKKESSR